MADNARMLSRRSTEQGIRIVLELMWSVKSACEMSKRCLEEGLNVADCLGTVTNICPHDLHSLYIHLGLSVATSSTLASSCDPTIMYTEFILNSLLFSLVVFSIDSI
jgi:hypothetical protein